MVSQSLKLGGTASHITTSRVGHGLMMMLMSQPYSDEACFESIKAGIDALPPGTKGFLNSSEFYDPTFGTGNLKLLNRFFAKYPEYVDRTFLSVKGGFNVTTRDPDGSIEYLRASVDNCQNALGTLKKIDLFQPARIDTKVPLETLINNLVTLKNEGKFDHIGLSECNGDTLRKAHAIHPITVAEIEISPLSYGEQQKKVIKTATELNITVAAYAPIGKAFITGQYKKPSDVKEGDIRTRFTRFTDEEVMKHNLSIVDVFEKHAKQKGVTTAQLAIAWVASLGPTIMPLPGSSKAVRTLENLEAGDIVLTEEEVKSLTEFVDKNPAKGDRYAGMSDEQAHLWR